jgi:O-acetylhomoserine/O-acetylserine sulfhydrylase-like pyridoxal-dependent enzyme
MVSSAFWKKVSEFFKEDQAFEKVTSVCFFNLPEKPYYYLSKKYFPVVLTGVKSYPVKLKLVYFSFYL